MDANPDFWAYLDALVAGGDLVIDRPKGSAHPRFPAIIYPMDYGYLAGTTSADGGGIDVWVGSLGSARITAVACTVDLMKRDAEVKLLLGCTEDEIQTALRLMNSGRMRCLLIRRD